MSSSVQQTSSNSETSPGLDNNEIGHKPPIVVNDKKPRSTRKRPTLACRMMNLCKEIAIMFVIAMAYAALTNERPPKISKSPAAYPFFPKGSLVADWYRGQITKAIEEARTSDVSFVMFYAPWNAQSQHTRKEFELAAKIMHKQISFSSINCWQPGSECKRQYSKVYRWPVLIAYPTHGRGIQYNGPLDAPHMIKFLQNICKPIVLPERINELIARHDVVVLANVNVLPRSYEYAVYYLAAMRFLERDPFREVGFAVMPQRKEIKPSLHLYIWNGTVTYKGEWDPDEISSWILKNLYQVASWLFPSGTKSLSLSSYIQPGPALILFTPRNPLLKQVDYYDLLKETAYEYHNCDNQDLITLKQKIIHLSRKRNQMKYQELKRTCLQFDSPYLKIRPRWSNSSVQTCSDLKTCQFKESPVTKKCEDKFSQEHLQNWWKNEECLQFFPSEKYVLFEKDINEENPTIAGLACKTNRSLSFIAMDSVKYYHFAEQLGVNLSERRDRTAAVIINERLETHHVMENHFNAYNLRSFITNFTDGFNPRSLDSPLGKKNVYPKWSCGNMKNDSVCIKELNSENFIEAVKEPNKALLVYYYSKQCAFCSGIAYTFLRVAKALASVKNLNFARIDGDTSLLPWEYTMESYPTILFFPLRKTESRAFPQSIPVTVPNLLGFILTNSEPSLKLGVMWTICEQTAFNDEKTKCIDRVRAEILSVIGKTLKEWRITNSRLKSMVLHKLQTLQHLHLLVAHSPEEIAKIRFYLNKL